MTVHPRWQQHAARIATTERLLVALDFDGTLSPLIDDPMAARMHPAARAAVQALTETDGTVVALVSGRSMADLRIIAEHDDTSPIWLAGSHGAQFWFPGTGLVEPHLNDSDRHIRDAITAQAQAELAQLAGVLVEQKQFGFGVHTRRASLADEQRAREIADALVQRIAPEWRRRTGHNIVEYAFRYEGKDSAVHELRTKTAATAVLFVGDDVTDEDALRRLGEDDLGIHVGSSVTAAALSVPTIPDLAEVLASVANLRGARRT